MNFFDLHADIPLKIQDSENNSCVDLFSNSFNEFIQVAAIWINDGDPHPFETYKKRLNVFKDYLNQNKVKILKQGEVGHSGVIMSVENGAFLADYPEKINTLYDDGIRMIALSWNGENKLAGGCNSKIGLTKKGRAIIEKMNDLNIVTDISHLNEKSSLEAIEVADFVLASHSSLLAVANHNRNLSDQVLFELGKKGGIVGICFYPPFLGGGDVFEKTERCIYYLCSLGMEDSISIGSDFDGADMSEKLCQTADVLRLYEYLLSKNITKKLLDKIFYSNALAFFNKICDNKLL